MGRKKHRKKKTASIGKQSDSVLIRGITINLPALDSTAHDTQAEEKDIFRRR